jgi:hypothetical protein
VGAAGRSTKLTIGAALCIGAGILAIFGVIITAISANIGDTWVIIWLIMNVALGLIAIQGGRYALKQERFWWAIVGSLCAILSSLLLGIPAIILIILSRKEFR